MIYNAFYGKKGLLYVITKEGGRKESLGKIKANG